MSGLMSNGTPPIVRNRSPLRRLIRAMIIFIVVPYLGIALLLAFLQRSMIYGPVHDTSLNVRLPGILGARVAPISLLTADRLQLNGWHVIAEKAAVPLGDNRDEWSRGKPLVLYFCGNARNRAHRVEEFQLFAELGAHALCFDYRGYCDNAGSPS